MKSKLTVQLTRILLLFSGSLLVLYTAQPIPSAQAEPSDAFTLIFHSPLSNALDIPRDSSVTASFSNGMMNSTFLTTTFSIRGDQTGIYSGVFTFPCGNCVAFAPDAPFKPGENITVDGTGYVHDFLNAPLIPYSWQFFTASDPSPALMSAHPISPTFGSGDGFAIALGDLDGDTDLDAVVANSDAAHANTVWINDGSGGFSPHPNAPTFGNASALSQDIAIGDLDLDGDLDAVVANRSGPQTVFLNDGTGIFTSHPISPTFGGGNSYGVVLADIGGNGYLDAVVANYGINEADTVWFNDSTGGFFPHPTTPTLSPAYGWSTSAAAGDMDGDGFMDIVVSNFTGDSQIWRNGGYGDFTITSTLFAGVSTTDVALGDLNGDSYLDAVFANASGSAETVWLNDGSGTLTAHPTQPTFGPGAYDVALGDLDGDGDLDALLATNGPEAVWLNDGSGVFTLGSTFGEDLSYAAALGDLDGEGDLDAVVANSGGAPQTVWLNQYLIYLPVIQK